MTLGNRLYLIAGLVAVIALAFAAVTMISASSSAQTAPPTTAVADDHADGETADDSEGQDAKDNQADGETSDDGAACDQQDQTGDTAESETGPDTDNVDQQCGDQGQSDDKATGDNGDPTNAGKLDDGKDLLPQASITVDQAIAAAQTAASGNIGEIDLEDYNGKLVFDVDVGDTDVKVDASNGTVIGSGSD